MPPLSGKSRFWTSCLFSAVILAEVTAYSISVEEGTIGGITYTGKPVTKGICAVDPAYISLGTLLYIPGYGPCKAEDTGEAIKGNRIDVFFHTQSEAWAWGRQQLQVTIGR